MKEKKQMIIIKRQSINICQKKNNKNSIQLKKVQNINRALK